MKIDLSQEYKDNLYEKVLEKKKQRTKTRKVLLNTFLVFVSVVGIASYGFSKLSKGDYNNFFISKTDNIEFNDEYEYFDDLGIKLEFINKDENSLTLGINIKYENIKDYEVILDEFYIKNKYNLEKVNDEKISDCFVEKMYNSNSEVIYILKYDFLDSNLKNQYIIGTDEIKVVDLKNGNREVKKIKWNKEISIE